MNRMHAIGLVVLFTVVVGAAQSQPSTETKPPSDSTAIVGPSMKPPDSKAKIPTSQVTPKQVLPDQKVRLPAVMTFVAYLGRVKGALPAKLGGWTCTKASCSLTTSGPATDAKLLALCRGLRRLAKEQRSVSFAVEKLRAENGAELDQAGIRTCAR
jgi:hypothetical protein